MTKLSKVRSSNIELLRLLCMFMIVIHHFLAHGDLWMLPASSTNKLIVNLLMPFGKICFDAFVAISCWFLVSSRFKGIRYLKIWLQVLFFNVVFTVGARLLQGADSVIGGRALLGSLFPMVGNSHGFAAGYLAFYLVLPILKKVQSGLNRKQTLYVLYILGMTQVAVPLVGELIRYTQPLQSEFLLFVFVYFLAYYLQNWPIKLLASMWVKLLAFAVLVVVSVGNNVLAQYSANTFVSYLQAVTSTEFSLLNILAGFLLFSIFRQLPIPNSKVINFFASTTFGVLLLHDHNYFRTEIWTPFKTMFDYEALSVWKFIVVLGAVSAVVFAVGVVVDLLRQYLLESWLLKTKPVTKLAGWLDEIADSLQA